MEYFQDLSNARFRSVPTRRARLWAWIKNKSSRT